MKKIFFALLVFLFCGVTTAYEQPLIYALRQYTPAVSIQSIIFKNNQQGLCYSPKNVTIRILMYHYVREDNRDPKGSYTSNNSISPKIFESHAEALAGAQQNNSTSILFLSELETALHRGCFPNKDITILTFDDGRRDNYGKMFPILEEYGLKANLGIIYNQVSLTDERIDPFMTYREIQELLSTPLIEIQSHTLSHKDLSALSYQDQYDEICLSKYYLEGMFYTKINTLIYPAGKYNKQSIEIAKSCGYTFGLTTQYGNLSIKEINDNPFTLKRIRITKKTSINEILGK